MLKLNSVIEYQIKTESEKETKKIIIESKIGEGGYGEVYKGLLDGFGNVAVKIQKLDEKNYKSLMTEIRIRKALGSTPDYAVPVERVLLPPPHEESDFVSIVDTLPKTRLNEPTAISIFPYAGAIDLFEMVDRHYSAQTDFSKNVLTQYITELIKGLKNIHDAGIAHRDIKPENIMLGDGKCRYIDFGFACFYAECEGRRGTANYLAPEMFKGLPIKSWNKLDIFALGNTLFFLLSLGEFVVNAQPGDFERLKTLYTSASLVFLKKHIEKRVNTYLTGNKSVYIPLILGMTEPDESKRMSIDDCVDWVSANLKK